jgi:Tfp pilus assembly protein PilX
VRYSQFNSPSSQRGYLMMLAVVMIVIVGFIGAAISNMFFSSTLSTTAHYQSDSALYLAESGLEHATHKLLEPTVANRLTCVGYNTTPLTNTLGSGAYSVTSVGSPNYVSSPTTLSSSLTAATTTSIPVVSTANYQIAGRIMIDSELINYNSISGTSFNNVTRGVDGTSAATHVSGTVVGQYQCNLTSIGGIPNVTTPVGKRSVNDYAQLQEAWTVGDKARPNYTFGRWNNPSETTWQNSSSAGAFNLTGIAMISYVDGWAVGASSTFLHWNGNTWSAVATGLAGTNYPSIFCNATNDCHAVGNSRRFGHWNGSTWTQLTASGSLANTNLLSVNCDSSSDCWAVGDNAGGGKFYSGTGSPVAWVGIAEAGLTAYPYNSVFCNNATDCWATGANATFARKNGASWANFATGLPAVQYNSVFCNNASDCWVVGKVNGGQDMFAHWNGTVWSRDGSNPTPIANLYSIACSQANDCWAVGSTNAGNNPAFTHWDGTSWTSFTNITGGAFSAATLRSISIISPSSAPLSGWSEIFS